MQSAFTECDKIYNPPNGQVNCDSKRFAFDTSCYLSCNPGYIPIELSMTTCRTNRKTGDFEWDIHLASQFKCVQPVGFIIGGMDSNYELV